MSYAVVNHVRLNDPAAAAKSTREVVLPRLRQLPGFEQAIFLADEAGGSGFSIMVFGSRDQAEEMAARLGNGEVPAPPGITFERQEVHEVVAAT
jgi:hypothetical protein